MRAFVAVLVLALGACASAAQEDPLARDFGAFLEAVRADGDLPPGFAVVLARGDEVVFEQAYGVREAARGAPLLLDTPIISASISKSHMALLAARLDAKGVLSLDATLREVWPELQLPAPLDANAITVRRLLSHSSGMADEWLNLRSITAGNVALGDVVPHLSRYATTTEPGFQYSNFGVFLYSMMVEQVTGRDWRAVLEDEVFRPMALTRTTIRLTDLPQDEIAHCHARVAGDWRTLPLEAPEALNAAGGIYMSVRDASRFVRAFAARGAARGAISPAEFERTLQQEVTQSGDLLGFSRDGYGLGWDLSDYEGQRIVSRSGGYPGCRSLIAFSPSTGVSIAAFGVGDAGVNPLLFTLAKHAFDLAAGAPRAQERLAQYREQHAAAVARSDGLAWPDLAGRMDAGALAAYAGSYASDLTGRFDIAATERGLELAWGVFRMTLLPAEGADAFNGYVEGFPDAQAISFERDGSGRVVALKWDDAIAPRLQ